MDRIVVIALLLAAAPSHAARIGVDECAADLVFVGRIVSTQGFFGQPPAVDPHAPAGTLSTHVVLEVERVIVDGTHRTRDGRVAITIPGGRLGTRIESVGSGPDMRVGERWALAMLAEERPRPALVYERRLADDRSLAPDALLSVKWSTACAWRDAWLGGVDVLDHPAFGRIFQGMFSEPRP